MICFACPVGLRLGSGVLPVVVGLFSEHRGMTQPSDVAPAVIGDSIRMLEQCGLWSTWLGEPPALPGKPCNFVNTSRPELVFGVPDGTKDHMTFQPHLDEGKNWQRFHSDSLMPGGTRGAQLAGNPR